MSYVEIWSDGSVDGNLKAFKRSFIQFSQVIGGNLPCVSKCVMVGAEQDTVMEIHRPADALGDDVVIMDDEIEVTLRDHASAPEGRYSYSSGTPFLATLPTFPVSYFWTTSPRVVILSRSLILMNCSHSFVFLVPHALRCGAYARPSFFGVGLAVEGVVLPAHALAMHSAPFGVAIGYDCTCCVVPHDKLASHGRIREPLSVFSRSHLVLFEMAISD